MRTVHFIDNPSELGAGTRGASLGFAAVKIAAAKAGETFFLDYEQTRLRDLNILLYTQPQEPEAKYVRALEILADDFSKQVSKIYKKGVVPFVFSGDHSNGYSTICALRKRFPKRRLGVIWIDAHADLHSPYTSPSGNMHGMSLAAALGADNLESQASPVSKKTAKYWNKYKNVGKFSPKILPQDLVQIGLRSVEKEEKALIDSLGIRQFSISEIRTQSAESIGKQALTHLAGCDMIYVSFDVDSMDSDIVGYGTGTPVPQGLTPAEAQELLQTLCQSPKLKTIEFTEVNPLLDTENKMAGFVVPLVKTVLENI